MSNVMVGVIAGLIFGVVDVALMIPMTFPDKRTAMIAAFSSRFAIGFLIAVTQMPVPAWVRGAIIGLLISIPDAIVTKSYAPILASGIIGGAIIGAVVGVRK